MGGLVRVKLSELLADISQSRFWESLSDEERRQGLDHAAKTCQYHGIEVIQDIEHVGEVYGGL